MDDRERILEDLVLVDDLDSMLILVRRDVLAHRGEVGVHHEGRSGGVLDIAGTTAIDLVRFGHIGGPTGQIKVLAAELNR